MKIWVKMMKIWCLMVNSPKATKLQNKWQTVPSTLFNFKRANSMELQNKNHMKVLVACLKNQFIWMYLLSNSCRSWTPRLVVVPQTTRIRTLHHGSTTRSKPFPTSRRAASSIRNKKTQRQSITVLPALTTNSASDYGLLSALPGILVSKGRWKTNLTNPVLFKNPYSPKNTEKSAYRMKTVKKKSIMLK